MHKQCSCDPLTQSSAVSSVGGRGCSAAHSRRAGLITGLLPRHTLLTPLQLLNSLPILELHRSLISQTVQAPCARVPGGPSARCPSARLPTCPSASARLPACLPARLPAPASARMQPCTLVSVWPARAGGRWHTRALRAQSRALWAPARHAPVIALAAVATGAARRC